jgi:glycosyltransferase involved in cell wall biosynthesis
MAQIKIYGQFWDHWSNAGVSRGLAAGLAQNGIEVALSDENNQYRDLWGGEFECGWDTEAPIGMFVGYPVRGVNMLEKHEHTVGALICESSILPADWGAMARSYDLVVVPSSWVADVYKRAGVPFGKLMVVRHGLHPAYQSSPSKQLEEPEHKILKFLHVSGARDFLDRKGTPQLIKAFARVFGDGVPPAQLTIRSPASTQLYDLIDRTWKQGLFDVDGALLPLSPEEMVEHYSRGWDALIQPSRAEAFGICPVEARAMGIPVILTACTGHSEHFDVFQDVVIGHENDAPIAVNGIPAGTAPQVTADEVEKALRWFLSQRSEIVKIAFSVEEKNKYLSKFAWKSLTWPLSEWVRKKRP